MFHLYFLHSYALYYGMTPPPDLQPDQIGPSPDSEIIKDCYLGRPLALVLVFCEVLFCE